MARVEKLETKVSDLYEAKSPGRADWADWLYRNHILVVANNASELAKRFGADQELSRAGALLHDIADSKMKREDERHEEESLQIARSLLKECGFIDDEIKIVVDDAIAKHSCREGQGPSTLEGKVLATADALAHLNTNFYTYTTQNLMHGRSEQQKRSWAANKILHDYYDKITFDDVREETKSNFGKLSTLFSE